MGLFDRMQRLFATDDTSDDRPAGDPEDLLDISAAALQMETIGYEPIGEAALCFQIDDAETTIDELRSVVEATTDEAVTAREDTHGFQWLVFRAETAETLASVLQFAASALFDSGHREALLAAVIGFVDEQRAYWIYSFERGRFYPFVPTGDEERDVTEEFKLRGSLLGELPVEDDESAWHPLWPDRPGNHPWE